MNYADNKSSITKIIKNIDDNYCNAKLFNFNGDNDAEKVNANIFTLGLMCSWNILLIDCPLMFSA